MLFLPIITTTLLSSLAIAMPTTLKRQTFESVEVSFTGAAGASYNMLVVTNSVTVPTNNDLSVTSISMFGRADFVCTAFGIDGSVTELVADEQNVPVDPPQIQTSVQCAAPPDGP